MFRTTRRSSALLIVLLIAALALALFVSLGCSTQSPEDTARTQGDSAQQQQQQTPSDSQAAGATIIDVRTAEEYAAGHLEGAINIDFYKTDFADQIAELDKSGNYILYCRTGVRAGKALDIMTGLGFTDVTNGMGMEDAAKSTGLDIVK